MIFLALVKYFGEISNCFQPYSRFALKTYTLSRNIGGPILSSAHQYILQLNIYILHIKVDNKISEALNTSQVK